MRKQNRMSALLALSLASATLLAGCGEKHLPKNDTYPVQGTLRIKGEPGAFVLIHLQPVNGKGAECVGTTRADGSFELRTYSNEDNDGAVPGEYKITLEEHDPVRAGPVEKGGKPTPIPNGAMTLEETREIKAEPTTLEIDVP